MTKRKDSVGDLSPEHRSDRRCKSFADAPASSMGGIVGRRSSRRKRSRDDTESSHRKSKKPFEPSQSSCPRRDGRLADAGDSTDPDDRKGVRETIRDIPREFPGLPEELARQLQRSRNLKGSEVGRSEQIKPRKLKQRLQSRSDAIPEPTPFSESPSFVAVVDDVSQRISMDLKQILTEYKVSKFAETVRAQRELRNLTSETAFCDIYGGDSEGREAQKVALLASKCVISLSSFSGERRRRVCSGFVIQSDSSTRIYKILSAATLIRSLTKHNAVDSDLRVKVCLPSGVITDAFISMIDLHYNLLLLEVKSEENLDEGILVRKVVTEGAVLALGRFYDDGSLMCAKGNIRTESTDSDCSELSLSSCQTTMAGVGGPLVNYSGQILGMNFYGLKNTPFLSMAIVVRCLEQWKHFGQIARPCIGFSCSSIDAVPLKSLEKCPYVDNGLFIPKVAKGSFADLAGMSVGDVITRCAGKDLSNAPELGALLLDICTEQMQPDFRKITLELVVVKQKDGSRMKITIDADALRECDYYRWSVPGPKYSHQNNCGEDVMRLL